MSADDLFLALERFSSVRDTFLLRDFRDEFSPGLDTSDLLRRLLPALSQQRLVWSRKGKEIVVARYPHTGPAPFREDEIRGVEKRLDGMELSGIFQDLVEAYISGKTGKSWNDPVVLDRIRTAVMQQKSQYWKAGERRRIGYRKGYGVFAYLAYQAPVTIAQFMYIFLLLARQGVLPGHLRILDAGTGPGIVPLALAELFPDLPGVSAEVYSLERSEEFIDAYCHLVPERARASGRLKIHRPVQADLGSQQQAILPSSLDMVVMQNVLNELPGTPEERATVISSLSRLLVPGGLVVIIEPAELENSTALRKNVLAVREEGLVIREPCRFLRGTVCGPGSCWSFLEKPSIHPTRLMQALSGRNESFRFENTDIKFSYAVLSKDRIPSSPVVPKKESLPPLSALGRLKGKSIDVLAAVMSGDLGDNRNHVFLLCDGTATAFAVLPRYHIHPGNRDLLTAAYSSVWEFSRVKVRWNPGSRAWNLLVTRDSSARPARIARDEGQGSLCSP